MDSVPLEFSSIHHSGNEVDNLLRAKIFIDLFAVVRHGILASVDSYSTKKLEPLYSFTRSVPLEDVGAVMVKTQARLEMADAAGVLDADKEMSVATKRTNSPPILFAFRRSRK